MGRAVSRQKMGWILIGFHAFMTLCTGGLWLIVVFAGRRKRKTVHHYPHHYQR